MAVSFERLATSRRAAPDLGNTVYSANLVMMSGVLVACWAAWLRMGGQWFAPSFNTSGIAAMGAAMAYGGWRCRESRAEAHPVPAPFLVCVTLLLGAYGAAYGNTPRLVTSIIAVLACAVMLMGILPRRERDVAWGLVPWMLASLPLGAAVNLYFGYPLRVVVGWIGSLLLLGEVAPLGTGLSDGEHMVFVDAPCSGIQMLRVAVLLAGMVAVVFRLRASGTALLLVAAFVLAILGNALRVCILFLLTRRGEVSEAMHTWSGVGIFLGCALALVCLGAGLKRAGSRKRYEARTHSLGAEKFGPVTRGVFFVAGLLAFLAPFRVVEAGHVRGDAIPWPEVIDGEIFVIGPPDPALDEYRATLMGSMAQGVLQPSGRLVLLRQCVEPTLTMHTSENCYVVAGFRCSALPALRDAQGHLWSRFSAVHEDGRAYVVKQCFFDADATTTLKSNRLQDWTAERRSWPDSSSWYWAAARPGAVMGHTIAVTIAERREAPTS